jgi:hypothetical protein
MRTEIPVWFQYARARIETVVVSPISRVLNVRDAMTDAL